MSRMFDSWLKLEHRDQPDPAPQLSPASTCAPQRREKKTSGSNALDLSYLPVRSFRELDVDPRLETISGTTFTCSSCKSSLPESSLFCPKCDAFLGSVVTERQSNDVAARQESDQLPESPSAGIRGLWLHIRRLITTHSAA
jgi:hypothetical protein